jgi:pyruvate dehydrogenase E1 component
MFSDGSIHQLPDVDPQETNEWLESLDAVIDVKGKSRAHYLLARLMERAREKGAFVPAMVTTDYINTIPPEQEPDLPAPLRGRCAEPRRGVTRLSVH